MVNNERVGVRGEGEGCGVMVKVRGDVEGEG
jgi:hypothetical protein